jgi:hypothetical protein
MDVASIDLASVDHVLSTTRAVEPEILDIPDDVTQAALLAVAYFTGTDFKPAKRAPAQKRTHWNSWGQQRLG